MHTLITCTCILHCIVNIKIMRLWNICRCVHVGCIGTCTCRCNPNGYPMQWDTVTRVQYIAYLKHGVGIIARIFHYRHYRLLSLIHVHVQGKYMYQYTYLFHLGILSTILYFMNLHRTAIHLTIILGQYIDIHTLDYCISCKVILVFVSNSLGTSLDCLGYM